MKPISIVLNLEGLCIKKNILSYQKISHYTFWLQGLSILQAVLFVY